MVPNVTCLACIRFRISFRGTVVRHHAQITRPAETRRPAVARSLAAWLPVVIAVPFLVTETAVARTDGAPRPGLNQSTSRPESPLKIVISIRRQRMTVWDGVRKIAETPISSGRPGYDTPTGVFSVLQKNREHFSNLYDDAPMPFMQRLTWSGVALHAGALPGYPASHGCIRLPYSFARQLFDITRIGARVIVARDEIEPRLIANPKLPVPLPPAEQVADAKAMNVRHGVDSSVEMLLGVRAAGAAPASQPAYVPRRTRASVAAARAAELARLGDAITKAQTERDDADARAKNAASEVRAAQDAVSDARVELRTLIAAREAAQRGQDAAEQRLTAFVKRNRNDVDDTSLHELGQEEDALEQSIAAAEFEIHDIEAEVTERSRQIDRLVEAASAAQLRRSVEDDALAAASAALARAQADKKDAERALQRQNMPVSIFVSRKTGKVLVRQGFEPLFEAPVKIDHPEAPLGTHIFTALEFDNGERALKWSLVSITPTVSSEAKPKRQRAAQADTADPATPNIPQSADASLARVHLPDDVLERLAEYLKPGSTFMISDLDVSNETGKGTDFVLLTR